MITATEQAGDLIDMAYDSLEGCEDMLRYHHRHGTVSLQVLTQFNPEIAMNTVRFFEKDIKDKIVIEIGAGVGFLAIELAKIAKKVYAIEVDPAWSWIFTRSLYRHKPRNLTWIFGDAREVMDNFHGDVAIVVTRSDVEGLRALAYRMADKVIMPFQDSPEMNRIKKEKKGEK